MTAPAALADSMRRACRGHVRTAAKEMASADNISAGTISVDKMSAEDTLRSAEQLLDRILAGECESRDSALDLLTVDALVTQAMQIAVRDPDLLAQLPESAMKRISTR